MPKRQLLKIGASGSMLIAAMFFASEMPAICWLAPRIATAMYKPGATFLPVWPTCQDGGHHPESQAARDAAVWPPNIAASSCKSLNGSGPPKPRPPETITLASSSRDAPVASDLRSTIHVRSSGWRSYLVRLTVVTDAEVVAAGSNARARSHKTAGDLFSSIVAMALPP